MKTRMSMKTKNSAKHTKKWKQDIKFGNEFLRTDPVEEVQNDTMILLNDIIQ